MGWEDGKGLGKNQDGIKNCIQVKRREEGVGLGQDEQENGGDKLKVNGIEKKEFKWGDTFWNDAFNSAANKFKDIESEGVNIKSDSSSSESSDDESVKEVEIKIIKAERAYFRSKKSKSIKKK